jgi:hypothetical protein
MRHAFHPDLTPQEVPRMSETWRALKEWPEPVLQELEGGDAGYTPAMPGVAAKVPALKPEAGGLAADILPPEVLAQNTDR